MNRSSYMNAVCNQDAFQIISSSPKNEYFRKRDVDVTNQWLLPGEEIKFKESGIGYQSDQGKVQGSIWVTNYRLRFQRLHNDDEQLVDDVWDVSLGSISKIKKMGHSKVSRGEDSYGILIKCKDMRKIVFYCKPENHSRRQLYENLSLYAFPNTNKLPFFATLYKAKFSLNGWTVYNAKAEFQRMGIPNKDWNFTDINKDYKFAPTYPACAIDKGQSFIESVGQFRSKKRLPVLSWYDKQTGVSVTRCSQPMVGIASKRSPDDEMHIQMIIDANPNNKKLLILDARPLVNARVNRAVGGGYEEGYENCELAFLDIQNIHAIRDSLKGVKSACYPRIDYKTFNKSLDHTRWLSHIQTIMSGAKRAVSEILTHQRSVLVHCSDGWDRTAQLVSLTIMQLDPYYRTLEGFIVLIEKDWCSFGHKFAHRVGHGEDKHEDVERSPIFVQFIDCVWQLLNQFVTAFEFNVQLLKTILDELYACRFGTFLYNNEKERNDLQVKKNTVSLWSYVLENRAVFINDSYNPDATSANDYFFSSSKKSTHAILWTDYYCQYNSQVIVKDTEVLDSPNQDQESNVIYENGNLLSKHEFTSL